MCPKNDIITRRSFKNYVQDAFLPEHSLRASSLIWASEVSLARTREAAPRGFAARSTVICHALTVNNISVRSVCPCSGKSKTGK